MDGAVDEVFRSFGLCYYYFGQEDIGCFGKRFAGEYFLKIGLPCLDGYTYVGNDKGLDWCAGIMAAILSIE